MLLHTNTHTPATHIHGDYCRTYSDMCRMDTTQNPEPTPFINKYKFCIFFLHFPYICLYSNLHRQSGHGANSDISDIIHSPFLINGWYFNNKFLYPITRNMNIMFPYFLTIKASICVKMISSFTLLVNGKSPLPSLNIFTYPTHENLVLWKL